MKPPMKSIIPFIISLFVGQTILAQAPLVKQWDKRFGGTGHEILSQIHQTFDGGYILGGSSWSGISGDKTQANWDYLYNDADYWIIKIDSIGNKQWDKRFGGTDQDELYSLQQTNDGGYILGGLSQSIISGDKTQSNWGAGSDYWIVKIDSLGNKLWDRRFGGLYSDFFTSLQQTSDGGYILGGWSWSGIGGDKTQDSWDNLFNTFKGDYWIIKIDSLGNKQWDKRYGGTKEEILSSVRQTSDGGYILGGWSSSHVSGDRTQPNRDNVNVTYPGHDYWIVKTDSLGNKQWDKRFGGTVNDYLYSLQQTTDGGYISGGYSLSGISGDKTQPSWGGADYWLVKIDSLGSKQWDKVFGGTEEEEDVGNILITPDDGFLITGTSYSDRSGDKSESNLGAEHTWIVKTDWLGNKQWDKTILTNGHDETGYTIQTFDGCYVTANNTNGGIAGYKTQPNWDSTYSAGDFWIIKFCDTSSLSVRSSFSNITCNGLNDGFAQIIVQGGAPPYQYLWNTGATTKGLYNIPADIYSVTVSDTKGATFTTSITINEPPPLFASSSATDILCNGETGGATATGSNGTPPYFYSWSNAQTGEIITGLQAGVYTVVVTDSNNCTAYDTIIIGQPSVLILTTNSVTAHVTCLGASDGAAKAFASGGTPPYSFLWSDGQSTDVPTGFPAGTHSVTVTDYNGCTATTSITIAEGELPCTGIQENLLNNISLYPNPTSGTVILQAEIPSLRGMESLSIKLYDALGRQVSVTPDPVEVGSGKQFSFDLKNLPGNIFFLSITTDSGSRVMKVLKY